MAEVLGKKVFFLYPPSVIQEEMLHLLISAEYEVALLREKQHTLRAISRFPDSILFINIDERTKEDEWESFIRGIMTNEKTINVRIGILSYNDNPDLKQKYLMDMGVPCGFITLKLGLRESFRIMARTLEVNEAKGRRKYVRAVCHPRDMAMFNVKYGGEIMTGSILDISSVGMACTFDKQREFKLGIDLQDIQLKLRAVLCRVSGKLVGVNKEAGNRHVIIFSNTISPKERHKIHQFVHDRLQESVDAL